jgi:hypothetical protein
LLTGREVLLPQLSGPGVAALGTRSAESVCHRVRKNVPGGTPTTSE